MASDSVISRIEVAVRTAESIELSAVISLGEMEYHYRLSTWPPYGAWMEVTEEGHRVSSSTLRSKEPSETLAEFWRAAIEGSEGGELQLASISARSKGSPLSGKELRDATIAAWCEVAGRPMPTSEEINEVQRQKREETLNRNGEKERERKTLASGTRQDLWAEIVANPDDDEPRLVYADWLEENGLADQAKFIRRHIQLSHDPRQDIELTLEEHLQRPGHIERSIKEQLCHEQRKSWSHIPEITGLDFDRGFVSLLAITTRQFIKHADEIAERIPALTSLSLGGGGKRLADLAEVSALSIASSLQMSLRSPNLDGWGALVESPHLT